LSLPPPFRPAAIPFQPHLLSSRSVVEVRSEQELREALNKARQSAVVAGENAVGSEVSFSTLTVMVCSPVHLRRTLTVDVAGLVIMSAGANRITGTPSTLIRVTAEGVRLSGLWVDGEDSVCVSLAGASYQVFSECWFESTDVAVSTDTSVVGGGLTVGTRILGCRIVGDVEMYALSSVVDGNVISGDLTLLSGSTGNVVTSNMITVATNNGISSGSLLLGNNVSSTGGTWATSGNI
jgi:hypothetical protein